MVQIAPEPSEVPLRLLSTSEIAGNDEKLERAKQVHAEERQKILEHRSPTGVSPPADRFVESSEQSVWIEEMRC